jgi:hypothetical protein
MGKVVNGWRMRTDLGRYGTNYEQRAVVAIVGLGANLAEDAVYPGTNVDAAGQPLSGEHRYALRFSPGALPPVKGFLVADDLQRQALPGRQPDRALRAGRSRSDPRRTRRDVGPPHPARRSRTEKRANWLPAPAAGFTLALRLYWPKPAVLDGTWRPPAVVRV